MYLELAENNNKNYYSMMAQAPEQDVSNLYVYIPAQFTEDKEGMYVREDSFDMLPDFQWDQLQDVLEPYQERNLSLFGLGKKGRARRKARRAARQAGKIERIKIRGESGGGALGKVAGAISNIFGGGGAAGAPVEIIEPLPPPVQAGMFGIKGLPNWIIPVAAVGGLILVLARIGRPKRRK
ncbi:MAG: hypothetical protein IH845_04795 [Nanoarchaeota archaeon]|nr:hypothetical protein [Nanoarchaeota archaeon]